MNMHDPSCNGTEERGDEKLSRKIIPPLHDLGGCVFSVSSDVSLVQLDLAVVNYHLLWTSFQYWLQSQYLFSSRIVSVFSITGDHRHHHLHHHSCVHYLRIVNNFRTVGLEFLHSTV